jgi:hypothetical protein
MPGSDQAARPTATSTSARGRVTGGASVVGALRSYIEQAANVVAEAVQDEQEHLAERQQERVQQNPLWSEISDQLRSWEDDDGNYATGVLGDDVVLDRASRLEYGDEKNPPSPLIRMGVLSDVADINLRLNERFRQRGF